MINLEKEIREQPAVLAGTAAANMDTIRALVAEVRAADVASVQLAARGTSDHAAIYAQYLIHTIVGIPCGLSTPSVVSKYHGKLSFERTLVIGISQSGRAADALAVVERANQTGAVTVAVTNDPLSPLAKSAKYHLYCNAGPETSIAATKTFTSQMMVLSLLAAVWAGDDALLSALSGVAGDVERLLTYMPEKLSGIAKEYENLKSAVVLGRGFAYPMACEGTLKILETNGIKMRGYAVSDFHHGPKAQIHPGDTAIVVALRGAVMDDAMEMTGELLKIGAKVILITDEESLSKRTDVRVLLIPNSTAYPVPDAISAYCAAVTLQLFALELVLARGIDPDASKVLKKVTITV